MTQQESERKRVKAQESESNSQSGEEEDGDDEQQNSLDNFIEDDEQVSDDYVPRHFDDDEDYASNKKSKKQKKKKNKQKRRKMKEDDDELDEGDLQILDEQQEKGLRRLKKKNVSKSHNYEDQEESQKYLNEEGQDDDDIESIEYDNNDRYQDMSQQMSSIHQAIADQGGDIFQPQDEKRHFQEQEDKQIINFDIPERYYYQIRNYAKTMNKSIEETLKVFESQDRNNEAKWIYSKMKKDFFNQSHYDDKIYRDKIKNVLDALHKEKIQIMYIYYYRKKIYADALNLNHLWKIYELDEEWQTFKQQYQKISSNFCNVISSFREVDRLQNLLSKTVDFEKLKYFKQFQDFVAPSQINSTTSKRKNIRAQIINQMRDRGVSQWLQKNQVFLSPQNLVHNLLQRKDDHKPRTPHLQPRQQLQKVLKSNNPQNDRIKFPLLVPQKRVQTICEYLQLQLFSNPQLRQILKQRYYRRLVLTTTPTKKGNTDINLYNMYFPVKRIKDMPIMTLHKQTWILACQAQKLDLIKISLKFQWQITNAQTRNFQSDNIYLDLFKYYHQTTSHKAGQVWNLFRKKVITGMLEDYFFPAFFKEVKEDLTRQGEKRIIAAACQNFKNQLNKNAYKDQKVLAIVLQDKKLGIAFVDQIGQSHSHLQISLTSDQDLRRFVDEQILFNYINDYKPDKILIAANCRRAQTLRRQIREYAQKSESRIFCQFGQYQVPSLVAKQKRLQGQTEQISVLEAISMARLSKNPIAQILSLWNNNISENGILSMNLHPYQSFINNRKLIDALEIVAVQVVNLVGIDINDLKDRENQSNKKMLQFLCGFGPRKAYDFFDKIRGENIYNRKQLSDFVSGDIVFKNCSSFFKILTPIHKSLLDKNEKEKKKQKNLDINLLDATRIPVEWYTITQNSVVKAIKNSIVDMRQRKIYTNYSEQTLALIQFFKHPQKIRSIQWMSRRQENQFFDQDLVKTQFMNPFKISYIPTLSRNVNKEWFYSLLRQTPQTLKKYMIVTAKIMSVKDGKFLNVVIPQNGLFGSIKIFEERPDYIKGNFIKAIITGFPFDEQQNKLNNDQDDKQLLKVQMAFNFPHKSKDQTAGPHDCFNTCFPMIVKEIHPIIDLAKQRFQLKKQDKPVIEIRDQPARVMKTQYRKIVHPKFKNISVGPAIQIVKSQNIGQFVIRPSSQGKQFLNITWHFFKGIVAHIKIKVQQKSLSNTGNLLYRVVSDKDNKVYQNLQQIIDRFIKPMNILVQDVISNRKFLSAPMDIIQDKVKSQMSKDSNHIHYFFGCSSEYPQYFILVYMYRDKKPVKQLIKVRNSGLYFHNQQFQNIRDLISWFKQHLKDKQYQKFVKSYSLKR